VNAAALRVAAYAPQHLDALVRMWRASFEHGVGIVDPHPIAGQVTFFEEKVLPEHAVQLAWRDEVLVGFVASNAESVSQLYVRVDCIGQGIGARLLQLAKDRSAGSLWLYTFARNARARRFYERHGFIDVAHGFEPFWQLEDVRYEWTRSGAGATAAADSAG
jgi:ribosomal protein S18 acetylase RimI-like enzyme